MLNKEQIEANRIFIVERLLETKRPGMEQLVEWLCESGFFASPASTKYHGCYEGGLARHSLNVFGELTFLAEACRVAVPPESAAVACLLHDVCKVGAYLEPPEGGTTYLYNKEHPKGHARLSIKRIAKFIDLTEVERLMILHHMGVYGLVEFEKSSGEYPLRGGGLANAWHHHPEVKLMYFADELATLKEMAEEAAGVEGGVERLPSVDCQLPISPPRKTTVLDLVLHLCEQRRFSENTFGPGARTAGIIDHIRKELEEIEAAPDDLEEWIDVVLLALDGAWRAGHGPGEIAFALGDKLNRNMQRDWPDWRECDPDKAIEHIENADCRLPIADCGDVENADCRLPGAECGSGGGLLLVDAAGGYGVEMEA